MAVSRWKREALNPHTRRDFVQFGKTESVLNKGAKKIALLFNPLPVLSLEIIRKFVKKIEAMFREMKQCFGGFCYRFWSKAVPKPGRYRRKTAVDPLELVKDGQERTKILKTLKAMEGYVLFSNIAIRAYTNPGQHLAGQQAIINHPCLFMEQEARSAQVRDGHQQQRIIKTLQATEGYVMISSIAMEMPMVPAR